MQLPVSQLREIYQTNNYLKSVSLKMKTKMSLVGICAMVCELKSLVGFRLQNIFTVTNIAKSFIFKFNKKDNPAVNVFLESGVRLHITNFNRAKDERPSSFTAQLRKYVRNRLLTGVEQVRCVWVLQSKYFQTDLTASFNLYLYKYFYSRFSGGGRPCVDV